MDCIRCQTSPPVTQDKTDIQHGAGHLVHHVAEDGAHVGVTAHEVGRPVYRVDDPGGLRGQDASGPRRYTLLPDELGVGEPLPEPRDEQGLHLLVSLGHQVIGSALLAEELFWENKILQDLSDLIFFSE